MEDGSDGMTKYSNMLLDFIKTDIFQNRKNVSVEEVAILVAALTDLSVTLLAKFRRDPMEPGRTAEIGRDLFKQMIGKLGFDTRSLIKPSLYT
jgi:hypothetical protein